MNQVWSLLKRPHLIHSFRGHSWSFLSHFANSLSSWQWKISMNHGMTAEWSGMTSEWMNQVWSLLKRPHLIHSFRPHSASFQPQEWLVVESCLASRGWYGNSVLTGMRSEWQNDQEMKGMKTWRKGFLFWMTEWWRNEGDFRIKGFALLQKMSLISPSFGHSVSFLNDETDWNEVKRSENDWDALWMISFLCYFSFHPFSNDEGMTEWGEMRVFSEVEKKN